MEKAIIIYMCRDDLADLNPEKVAALRSILTWECDGDLRYGHAQVQTVHYQ